MFAVTVTPAGPYDPRKGIRALRRVLDLDRKGLGEKLLDAAFEGIKLNCMMGLDSDGRPWPELSAAYAAWKAARYPGSRIGYRDETMLADDQLRGVRAVARHEARMTYGVTDDARQEAGYFIEGDPARHRPAREFYALTTLAVALSGAILDAHVAAALAAA